jgi:hypothetical protein
MAGLDPAIHELLAKTWMPGTSPGMTILFGLRQMINSPRR